VICSAARGRYRRVTSLHDPATSHEFAIDDA
jgi:hypothetical protein